MIAAAGAVLAATLLGSPHCAGMCGGFACFVAGDAAGGRRFLLQGAYSAGRLLSYAALGAVAGGVGQGIGRLGALAGIARAAPILAGATLVVWGAANLFRALGVGIGPARPAAPSPAGRLLGRFLRAMGAWPPAGRAFAVGLFTTLIPCGFLYGFAGVASGTGDPVRGALIMAVFWAGTLPVMLSVGLIAQRAVGPLRDRLPVLTAALLIVLGLLTLAGRLGAPAGHHHPAASMSGASTHATTGAAVVADAFRAGR
ncbi:MAG: sulfite exporter TauE/SafE family protein [Hyphomicrobiales bacterium]